MPATPAFRNLNQEDHKSKVSLDNVVKPSLKRKKKVSKNRKKKNISIIL